MSWKGSALTGSVGSNNALYGSAGAIDLANDVAEVSTAGGAMTLTLADGAAGDRIFIILAVDGGNLTVTANLYGSDNTLTFSDPGDAVDLIFASSAWQIVGNIGTVGVTTV